MTAERSLPPGNLSCREFVELTTDYIEGATPQSLRVRLEEHLKACPGCLAYLDQLRIVIRMLGGLRQQIVGPSIRGRVRAVFQAWKLS